MSSLVLFWKCQEACIWTYNKMGYWLYPGKTIDVMTHSSLCLTSSHKRGPQVDLIVMRRLFCATENTILFWNSFCIWNYQDELLFPLLGMPSLITSHLFSYFDCHPCNDNQITEVSERSNFNNQTGRCKTWKQSHPQSLIVLGHVTYYMAEKFITVLMSMKNMYLYDWHQI